MKKSATSRVRLLGSAALVALLGLAVLAPVAVADRGHHGGSGHKPKYVSCKPLVNFGDAVIAVSQETGIAPEMGAQFYEKLPVGNGSRFRDVPTTRCTLEWINDTGNSPAYGTCEGCTQGVWATCAAVGVSKHDFKKTIPVPGVNEGGVCSSVYDEPYTVQTFKPPGKGSRGYVIAQTVGDQGYTVDYNVYAWTKKAGGFVSFDAWPLSLAASEGFVNKAVASLLGSNNHRSS